MMFSDPKFIARLMLIFGIFLDICGGIDAFVDKNYSKAWMTIAFASVCLLIYIIIRFVDDLKKNLIKESQLTIGDIVMVSIYTKNENERYKIAEGKIIDIRDSNRVSERKYCILYKENSFEKISQFSRDQIYLKSKVYIDEGAEVVDEKK